MEDTPDLTKFFQSAIERIERVNDTLSELFGEDSSEDGLFAARGSLLQQCAILSGAYHQLNTVDYLENDDRLSEIFEKELQVATYRTRDYENKSLRQLRKDLNTLGEFLEIIIETSEIIVEVQLDAELAVPRLDNSYYENMLLSVTFYLQEINSRILQPGGRILNTELVAVNKILKIIDDLANGSRDITPEGVARMFELISWGLEIPPGWKSIQNELSELTGDLQKKIGSLKALHTFYRP